MARAWMLSAALLLAAASPASAARLVIRGAPAPGPAAQDRVAVWTYGPASARNVLVLVPGTSGGAGSVAPVARDIAARVPSLQVWALDRREEVFEDQSAFAAGDLDAARAYYAGFKYKRPENVPYVADWGLAVQTADLRRVVAAASDHGRRRVILGGHSRGASQVAAYAAWDFKGRPGFRDLAGMVWIDGGLYGAIANGVTQPYTRSSALKAVEDAREQPFDDVLGVGVPGIGQIAGQLAATYAARRPDDASTLQNDPLVPPYLRRDFTLTNEAFFGTIFDKSYSPPNFGALRTRSGKLAPSGDPRGWISGERTPIERFAAAFSGLRPDFAEWYYPERLVIDVSAANPMRKDPASTALGLRLFHTRQIDIPFYAFQTDLTGGRVLGAARRLAKASKVHTKRFVSDTGMSHLDPVLAAPRRNTFLRTVVPFLREIVKQPATPGPA